MAPTNTSYIASIDDATGGNANSFVNTSIESTSFANFQSRMSNLSFLERLETGEAATESNRTDAMVDQIESEMKNLDMEGREAQEQWRKKALEKHLPILRTSPGTRFRVPKTEEEVGYTITIMQPKETVYEPQSAPNNSQRIDCPKLPKTEPKDDCDYEIPHLVSVRKRRMESEADIESKKRVLAAVYENIAKAATERLHASLGKMGVPMKAILQLIEKNENSAKGCK